jgi:hypothetical protein
VTFFVPAAYYHWIKVYCLNSDDVSLNSDPAVEIAQFQEPMAIFQTIGMLYLIFVSFYRPRIKEPLWVADAWVKYVPFVHAVVTILTFVVIPLIVMISTLTNTERIDQSAFKSVLWLNFISSLFVVFIWVPTQIVGVFLAGVGLYKKISAALELRGDK